MRQVGQLTAMTPAAFFALAFLAMAATVSPAQVDVTVSPVSCRTGKATVTLSAGEGLDHETGFSVHRDGRAVHEGKIGPGKNRTVTVRVPPGHSARIAVNVEGQDETSRTVRSSCERRRPRATAPEPLRPRSLGCHASVMPLRALPPADSRTAAATVPATSAWNTLGMM
ncbi:hypothetical protein AB0395_35975 [Streptosporangium sp. NPDC051023]|uniref:hypothetical protein n=1 Tax=Streptosporangium sp. NPDC051023 TaxID=3155410 RepID=UPI0034505730